LLALDFPGAAKATRLSRAYLYKEARRGALRVIKAGSKSLILVPDLLDFLNGLPTARFSPEPDNQENENEEDESEAEDPKLKAVAEKRPEAETIEGTEAEAESVVAAAKKQLEELSAEN
jgi:hypothetical protein